MTRFYSDCRDYTSEMNCTVSVTDIPRERFEAAVQYAVAVKGHQDARELGGQTRKMLKLVTT